MTRDDERARTTVWRATLPLLPSLFTIGNLLCGWAVIVHALRGDLGGAAPFVALAILFDMFDGRIARLTGTTSAFGAQLDSLADLVSFGVAPALLAYRWGLEPLGALGWLAGAAFLTAAAVRLARFNVHAAGAPEDRAEDEDLVGATDPGSHFSGLPSPAAAAVIAATVLMAPAGLHTLPSAVLALAATLVPAAQAGGEPELVVVARAAVQANDQAHLAQAGAQCIDIRQQVIGAAFFARLDQAHDARMRHALSLQCLDAGNGRIHGIAVIGTAPAIQLAVVDHRGPRPQIGTPA